MPVRGSGATVLWINGAHGVGKSTVARAIQHIRRDALLFDPEILGHAVRRLWPRPQPADFKDMPAWAELVAQALRALILDECAPLILVPMTVVDPDQLAYLLDALREDAAVVRHVTLTASAPTRRGRMRWRIDWPRARRWAREHGERAAALLADGDFAPHVATDGRSPRDIAAQLVSLCGA